MYKSSEQPSSLILVVEDDYDIGRLYQHFFQDKGIEVEVVRNGIEGLKALEKIKPDLILTDINMDRMDGNEFCNQVHLHKRTDAPIIAVTGCPELATAAFARIIKKPFRIDELTATVNSMINND